MPTDETVTTPIELHIKYHLIIILFIYTNNIFYSKEYVLKMKFNMFSERAWRVHA